MIREDIKNPQELNQELTYVIEDMWAKMVALSLGVSCPNERVKELFIHYAMKRYKKPFLKMTSNICMTCCRSL